MRGGPSGRLSLHESTWTAQDNALSRSERRPDGPAPNSGFRAGFCKIRPAGPFISASSILLARPAPCRPVARITARRRGAAACERATPEPRSLPPMATSLRRSIPPTVRQPTLRSGTQGGPQTGDPLETAPVGGSGVSPDAGLLGSCGRGFHHRQRPVRHRRGEHVQQRHQRADGQDRRHLPRPAPTSSPTAISPPWRWATSTTTWSSA